MAVTVTIGMEQRRENEPWGQLPFKRLAVKTVFNQPIVA